MNEELAAKIVDEEAIKKLQPILLMSGDNAEKIGLLRKELHVSKRTRGVDEVGSSSRKSSH